MIDRDTKLLEEQYLKIYEDSENSLEIKYADLESKARAGDKQAESEAQRMLDDIAQESGWIRSRHATGAPNFTVFDRKRIPEFDPDTNIKGFHFSNESEPTSSYRYQDTSKNRVLDVFLRLGRTISRREAERMISKGKHEDFFPKGFDTVIFRESAGTPTQEQRDAYDRGERVDLNNGYFIIKSEGEIMGNKYEGADLYRYSNPRELITGYDDIDDAFSMHGEEHYVVKNPNQIKSAEPFTYRDDGTLIPLSERFDSGPDIRGNVNI